jgi:hypothetical protein
MSARMAAAPRRVDSPSAATRARSSGVGAGMSRRSLMMDSESPRESGHDCQRETDSPERVLHVFAPELRRALGDAGYARLCAAAGVTPAP